MIFKSSQPVGPSPLGHRDLFAPWGNVSVLAEVRPAGLLFLSPSQVDRTQSPKPLSLFPLGTSLAPVLVSFLWPLLTGWGYLKCPGTREALIMGPVGVRIEEGMRWLAFLRPFSVLQAKLGHGQGGLQGIIMAPGLGGCPEVAG